MPEEPKVTDDASEGRALLRTWGIATAVIVLAIAASVGIALALARSL